jgi:hypothetical protein
MVRETVVVMDPDVQKVAAFMQQNIAAAKLWGIAEALHLIAPSLWGRYAKEDIFPLSLEE